MASQSKTYYVYILTNQSGSLYTGVTNDLYKRIWQHRFEQGSGFTSKYKVGKLLWFEETDDVSAALTREKQLKNWRRQWKAELIDSVNRAWVDLADGWYGRSIDPESSSG